MDIEIYGGAAIAYHPEGRYEVLACPQGVPLRAALSLLREAWPVSVPAGLLRRPENQGLDPAAVLAI